MLALLEHNQQLVLMLDILKIEGEINRILLLEIQRDPSVTKVKVPMIIKWSVTDQPIIDPLQLIESLHLKIL